MKKIIILSFIVLFFAGISNNANAQKDQAETSVLITFVWHCTPNPNANLYVHFDGYDESGKRIPYSTTDNVGSNSQKVEYAHHICYSSVNVTVDVSGDFAWAHATKYKSEYPYVQCVYITVDIYNAPPMMPAW